MDNISLKKKLSTFLSDKGYLTNVSDDVLYELLVAWENWSGSGKEFYSSLGFTSNQLAFLVGKAKKLKRTGHFGEGNFKQVKVEASIDPARLGSSSAIELVCSDGKVIRFTQVDFLIDFLRKSA